MHPDTLQAPDVERYTSEIKALVGRTAQNIVLIGEKLQAVKKQLLRGEWEPWLRENFDWTPKTAQRMMQVARRFKNDTVSFLPIEPGALYLLSEKSTPAPFIDTVIAVAKEGTVITQSKTKEMLATYKELHTSHVATITESGQEDKDEPEEEPEDAVVPVSSSPLASAPSLILIPDPPPVVNGQRPTFNQTNENVDWAKWTWNPVTGCLHNCGYCYARDIAERRMGDYKAIGFTPHFHQDRLLAPQYTKVPAKAETDIGYRNVFVCSMADLFGKWVPQEWIDAVLEEVRAAPQWNFLFLTKLRSMSSTASRLPSGPFARWTRPSSGSRVSRCANASRLPRSTCLIGWCSGDRARAIRNRPSSRPGNGSGICVSRQRLPGASCTGNRIY